jgi:hypothetical protein
VGDPLDLDAIEARAERDAGAWTRSGGRDVPLGVTDRRALVAEARRLRALLAETEARLSASYDRADHLLAERDAARALLPTQPAPSGGTGDVWAEVLDRLPGWGLAHLRERCEARRALGIARYGHPVQRDRWPRERWASEGEDEALDLAVYRAAEDGAPGERTRAALALLEVDRG